MWKRTAALAALLAALAPASALAAGATSRAEAEALAKQVHPQTGTFAVGDARIVLPKGYRYLGAADARLVLEQIYGNPPSAGTLGLILAPGTTVLDNRYVVVVTYDREGHVKDSDAAKISWAKVLQETQKHQVDENRQRTAQGYPAITIVGWAEPPHYDAASHKLYWASDLAFAGEASDTLNYEVRVLGRDATLELTAVSGVSDLAAVRTGMQTVLGASSFVPGHAYADYRSGDHLSKLGVGGLVAGGAYAAVKTGILAFLLAKIKFVLFAAIALVGGVGRRLRRLLGRGATS